MWKAITRYWYRRLSLKRRMRDFERNGMHCTLGLGRQVTPAHPRRRPQR